MPAPSTLASLLAPLDVAAFFARWWEREPLHLPGEGRREPLLTLEALSAALSGLADPPEGLLAFPEHLGRALTTRDLLRDPELYRAYLEAGHPLVWNRARGVSPEVDALSAALGEALGAHVWPNVYATGAAGTPFEMHFDCHEVLALHCEGHKEWQISAVRVDRPLDAVEMEPAVRATMRARRDEAADRPLVSYVVEPGDVVYVPRGQFHNAWTREGRSLHVTFGVQQPTGFDVVKLLARAALGDPSFREFFPPVVADPGGERAAAQLAEIVARARALLGSEALAAEVAESRAHLVRRS